MIKCVRTGMFLTGLFLAASFAGCGGSANSSSSEPPKKTPWTIMFYGDADCNLEAAIIQDVAEMKSGFVDSQGVNLIVLFDRTDKSATDDGYSQNSSVFGENFNDTRMYRITHGTATRISGGTKFPEITTASTYEANMGDGAILKKFVESCKEQYPADHYALILSNHGGGCKSVKDSSSSRPVKSSVNRSICYDETSGDDFLYTSEISDALTSADSVDLLGFDACLMSSAEIAYQYRKGNGGFCADYIVACAPTETGNGWQYMEILSRLITGGGDNGTPDATLGGNELNYDPASLTAAELGAVIVEEQRDSTSDDPSQSLTCLDLSKAGAVKTAVDALAVSLASKKAEMEALRGSGTDVSLLHYFDTSVTELESAIYYDFATEWLDYPFFDLYSLAAAINTSPSFDSTIQTKAAAVKSAVDDMVLYSFANSDFSGFAEGKNGVHIFFPDGDSKITFKEDVNEDGAVTADDWRPFWYYQDWYNAVDISAEYNSAPLGKLAWCADGATAGNSTVENWFELLDSWYDSGNDSTGGDNFYQY